MRNTSKRVDRSLKLMLAETADGDDDDNDDDADDDADDEAAAVVFVGVIVAFAVATGTGVFSLFSLPSKPPRGCTMSACIGRLRTTRATPCFPSYAQTIWVDRGSRDEVEKTCAEEERKKTETGVYNGAKDRKLCMSLYILSVCIYYLHATCVNVCVYSAL